MGQQHHCLQGAATSTHTAAAVAPPNAVPRWNKHSYLGTCSCFCLWLLRELSCHCRCSLGLESSTQHPPRGRSQWGEARENSSSAGILERLTCFPKASSNTLPRNRLGGDLIASPRFLAACGAGHATSPPRRSRLQITSPILIVGNSIAKPCCCPALQPEALQGKFMMSLKCFRAAGVLQHIDGVWHQLDQKSGAGGL